MRPPTAGYGGSFHRLWRVIAALLPTETHQTSIRCHLKPLCSSCLQPWASNVHYHTSQQATHHTALKHYNWIMYNAKRFFLPTSFFRFYRPASVGSFHSPTNHRPETNMFCSPQEAQLLRKIRYFVGNEEERKITNTWLNVIDGTEMKSLQTSANNKIEWRRIIS